MICETCVKIHKRDTNAPIQCPRCRQIIGCFWHARNILHIRNCERAKRGLPPLKPLWEDEDED